MIHFQKNNTTGINNKQKINVSYFYENTDLVICLILESKYVYEII